MKASFFSQIMNSGAVITASNTSAAYGLSFGVLIAAVATIVLMIVAIALVVSAKQKGCRIKPSWAVFSIIISAFTLLLCIVASQEGAIFVKASGNPQETVNKFFDSIIAGSYAEAYSCLENYSSLGLENQPETEDGRLIYDAVRESYSYELHGSSIEDKLTAHQRVNLQYLDLSAVSQDVEAAINPIIAEMAKTRSRRELYDEHNKYLPSVTDEAYSMALEQVLKGAKNYYITAGLELELRYTGGDWRIVADQSMINALMGGAAY